MSGKKQSINREAYQQGFLDAQAGRAMDDYFRLFDGYIQGYHSGKNSLGSPPKDDALVQELKDHGLTDYEIEGLIQGMEDAKAGKKRRRNYKAILGYEEGYNAVWVARKKSIDELCKAIANLPPQLEDEDQLMAEREAFLARYKRKEKIGSRLIAFLLKLWR